MSISPNDPATPHRFNTAEERRDVKAMLAKDKPAIIDYMAADLPDVFEPKTKGVCPQFVDQVWNDLRQFEIGILLSLDKMQERRTAITWMQKLRSTTSTTPLMRQQDAAIKWTLSWEQTVEDFAA